MLIRGIVHRPEFPRGRAGCAALPRRRIPGERAPLLTVASVEESRAYSSIDRIDGRRVVSVSANVDEATSTPNIANAEIVASVMPELERNFPGLRWVQAGSTREQNEDLADIGSAFIIVLLIIYAMIATQLRSYLQPLAILVGAHNLTSDLRISGGPT